MIEFFEVAMFAKWLLVTSTLALLFFWLMIAGVKAHSVQVLRTEPVSGATLEEAPPQIAVMLNEELMSPASTLQVFNSAGEQVDLGDGGVDLTDPDHATLVVHLPKLDDDAYTVRWNAVLVDGDNTEDAFTFTVGAGVRKPVSGEIVSPTASPVPATLPWIGASGALLAVVALGLRWRRRWV